MVHRGIVRVLGVSALLAGGPGFTAAALGQAPGKPPPRPQQPLPTQRRPPPKPMTVAGITETRLPNGLVVLTKEVHAAPVVCTYVWYRVGSRNEVPGLTGVSHQLEHMMFKGTRQKFPNPGTIDLLVGRYGGENNASTDTDATAYYLLLPADQLDLALRIEADRMTQAAIDPQQLTAEKSVVLSELEGNENDNASWLYDATRAAAYQYHPYHYPVIGTKWDVKHYTRSQVYDYYRAHYAPNNATLVIVGDFNTAKVLARVQALWKDVSPSIVPNPPLNPEPVQKGERRVIVRRAGATAYLHLIYHIGSANHPDLPALKVLATALSSGRSSRLYRALVETQLATSVEATANMGIDPETFDVSVSAQAHAAPEAVEKALLAELQRCQIDLLDDRELQKAKNQTRAEFLFSQESVLTQAGRIGMFQIETNDWRHLTTYLARINQVTAEEVRRVAQKVLTADNRTVGTFIPSGEKPTAEADSGGGRAAHYHRPNAIPRPSSVQGEGKILPMNALGGGVALREGGQATRTATLKTFLRNGLTVIVRENHANPTITVRGFVRAGSVNDPQGKYGLASMVADMLERGVTGRTSQEIAQEVDFVGAHLGASAERERIRFSAAMLTENFDAIFHLLALEIRRPTFPAEELEKVRGETLTALQEEEDDTATVANRRLFAALYPADNPYEHSPEGTIADVKTITRDDLMTFYRQAVRPERTTLVIVGDVTARTALAAAIKFFGDWNGEGEGFSAYAPAAVLPQPVAPAPIFMPLPDKAQDDIAMGLLGLSRKSPDYEAASLMNLILGGDPFVGRVGKRIRDTEGLAYYATTRFAPGLATGPWLFQAGVNPVRALRAIASARDEVRKMVAQGVTDPELAWAKDHAIGALRLSLATNAGMASQLENAVFYSMGLDYAERYPGLIRALTRAQVNAAAKRILNPEALVVVIAGPPVPQLSEGVRSPGVTTKRSGEAPRGAQGKL